MNRPWAIAFFALAAILFPLLLYTNNASFNPAQNQLGSAYLGAIKLEHEGFGAGLFLSAFLIRAKVFKYAVGALGAVIFFSDPNFITDFYTNTLGYVESIGLGFLFGFVGARAFFSGGRGR